MANSIFSRNRRAYVTPVVTYGTAVAPVNANCFRHVDLTFSPQQQESVRPDLNPSLDIALGTLGHKTCTFQGSCSLAAGSGAGTAPDVGLIFKSWLGKVDVVNSTSVTYSCDDVTNYIDLWQYVTPSTGEHEAGLSSHVKTVTINFGGDYAMVEYSGVSKVYLTSGSYATADTEGKCGLGAYPTEPASPVVNGAAVSGYRGTITLDGNAYTTARSGKLTGDNGFELDNQVWGSDYGGSGAPGQRKFSLDFSLKDDDSTNLNALKAKAIAGTAVDCSFVLGATAGGIFTFTLKNILLSKPVYDNSQNQRIVNFSNCLCHASTGTSKDAFKIAIT